MTLSALHTFGIEAENEGYERFVIPAGQWYKPASVPVEGDDSQAAFFLAYNTIAEMQGEEKRVVLSGLSPDSIQGDRAAKEILEQYDGEKPLTIDVSDIPDLVPALAAAAAFRDGARTEFTGGARLRLKESDRIRTTCRMVRALGAGVEEWEDGFAVIGKRTLPGGGIIDCACDHRIAMSAGIAAARCENSITLLGSECVAKSYPGFWEDFASLGGKWTCK